MSFVAAGVVSVLLDVILDEADMEDVAIAA
jgi:hypothetical protein